MRQILEERNLEFSFREDKCEILISYNMEISRRRWLYESGKRYKLRI